MVIVSAQQAGCCALPDGAADASGSQGAALDPATASGGSRQFGGGLPRGAPMATRWRKARPLCGRRCRALPHRVGRCLRRVGDPHLWCDCRHPTHMQLVAIREHPLTVGENFLFSGQGAAYGDAVCLQ
jgi:hypothetical protein